ncbi:MAG: isochorismate synthase [Synechocystis sp.]|nr:isochorismate synthase [Synechocystis sp.]
MSVATPPQTDSQISLDSEQALYDYLRAIQARLTPGQSRLFSFSDQVTGIDPLRVFTALNLQQTVHFYSENAARQEITLAFGICQSLRISGKYRFRLAQQFTQDCFDKLIPITNGQGLTHLPAIFCGFSFFDSPVIVSPFPNSFLFLPQIQLVQTPHGGRVSCQVSLDVSTNILALVESLFATLNLIRRPPLLQTPRLSLSSGGLPRLTHAADLSQVIAAGLQKIHRHQLSKVVLATALDMAAQQSFNVVHCLQRLRRDYGDCHLFSFGNGQGDCFIGASPERLLSLHNQHLITDALAGSAPRGKTPSADRQLGQQILHNPKERREHQAVLDYLLTRLTAIGLRPQASPLKLLKLSNIQHLWTQIQAPFPSHLHPLELVAQLHPTPAVAGVPAAIACEFIRKYETFERALYAAPLGWVDSQGNSEFIVGIRSALISQNHARLYAGAGIVSGSDPQQEVAEIELKLQTLWRSLA